MIHPDYCFPHQHVLTTENLTFDDINKILDVAHSYVQANRQRNKKHDTLYGRTLINVFFENSTRTLTSFELAGKRLGADVINMHVAASSVNKGETLRDTAATLNAMNPDFMVVRHSESGAVEMLSERIQGSVINAGDGTHEHPTQALLDALTLRIKFAERHPGTRSEDIFKGKVIAICGDILHSRVARSNVFLLKTMGAIVRLVAPPTLMPPCAEIYGVDLFNSVEDGLRDADAVMMLRVQKERMSSCFFPSEREYFHLYGLDYAKLALAKDNIIVMHPGPINRGLEIDSDLADDIHRSVILDQVENGVAVRQALLDLLGRR